METSKQARDSLQAKFSPQSRSRIALIRRRLQTITQGNRNCNDYIEDAKVLADQLAVAAKPIDDQDMISFLLGGLWSDFNPFITSYNFASHDKEFTLDDFQAELINFESLLESQAPQVTDSQFAYAATKPKVPAYLKKKVPQSHSAPSRPNTTTTTKSQKPVGKPICQICDKPGHKALDCYNRFNLSYQGRIPPADLAVMATDTNSSFENQVWFADSGANTHITSSMSNLTDHKHYEGTDTITVGNGSGQSDRQNPPQRAS